MAINFPDSPSPNDTHTVGETTWQWDGTAWVAFGTTALTQINATDTTADATLFPVMVTAAGSAETANVTTTKLTFDSTTGDLGASALTLQAPNTLNAPADVTITARGDAFLSLVSDTNSDSESNNPYILFSQDAAAVLAVVGSCGADDEDAQGNSFNGATNNSFGIHHRYATGRVEIGVNGQVGLRIDDSDVVTAIGGFSGSGASLTALTAANISSGNLGSGVLPYATGSTTSSNFKMPFYNTTTGDGGNYGLLIDNGTDAPYYNPSTNTFYAPAVTGVSIGGITASSLVDKGATETITGTWTLDGTVSTADYGTGGRVKDGFDLARPIGFNVMPVVSSAATLTIALNANGGAYYHASASAHTVNVNNDANIPVGATYVLRNWYQPTGSTVANGGTWTLNPGTGVYLWWASGSGVPTGGTGNRTLAGGGFCTLYKQTDTIWHMWGSGIS